MNNARGHTAYVVDPSPRGRANAIDMLERSGTRVVGQTGLGLRVLGDLDVRPDLVLIDPALPDAAGLSLLSQIRHSKPRTGIIVISRLESLSFVGACFQQGARAFVAKREIERLCDAIDALNRGDRFVSIEQVRRLLARARRARREPGNPFHRATPKQIGAAVTAALGFNSVESAIATDETRRSIEGSRRRLSESLGVVDTTDIGLLARIHLAGGLPRLADPVARARAA